MYAQYTSLLIYLRQINLGQHRRNYLRFADPRNFFKRNKKTHQKHLKCNHFRNKLSMKTNKMIAWRCSFIPIQKATPNFFTQKNREFSEYFEVSLAFCISVFPPNWFQVGFLMSFKQGKGENLMVCVSDIPRFFGKGNGLMRGKFPRNFKVLL